MSRFKEPRKRFTPIAALIAAFALLFMALGIAAPADAAAAKKNRNGNNGVVKIDGVEFDSHPDNQPHVGCTFQVDFYNYDGNVGDATVTFALQSPTLTGRTLTVTSGQGNPSSVPIGEDPAGGGTDLDAEETYTLAFTGAPHPVQGYHVKLTVNAPESRGNDVKHKVFWVEGCNPPITPPPPPPTTVTPTAPTPSDVCEPVTGPTNDRITIPSDANFTYKVDGKDAAAGSFVATGTSHTVKAIPNKGVVVTKDAKTEWTYAFTKVVCTTTTTPPPPPVPPTDACPGTNMPGNQPPGTVCTPPTETSSTELTKIRGAVKMNDKCGRAGDTYLAKRVKGGTYLVKGKAIREGVWLKARTLVVKVKLVPTKSGYEVAGKNTWTLRFTDKSCATPPKHLPPTGA